MAKKTVESNDTENANDGSRSETSGNKASVGATFRLSNTMIGASLLTLPYTVSRTGWVVSLVYIIGAFCFCLFGCRAIIDAAHYTSSRTLRDIITKLFGPKIAYTMDVFIVSMSTGTLTSYVSIIGDFLNVSIQGFSGGDIPKLKEWYVKVALIGVLVPITLIRSPRLMSIVSTVAICLIALTVFSIIGYGIKALVRKNVFYYIPGVNEATGDPFCPNAGCSLDPLPSYLAIAFPAQKTPWKAFLECVRRTSLFLPLFGCNPTLPPLLSDLSGPPAFRRYALKKAITIAIPFVFSFCVLVAFFTTIMFGLHTQVNLLISFPPTEIYITVIRLLYALNMTLSYSDILYPLRMIILSWCKVEPGSKTVRSRAIFYSIGVGFTLLPVTLSIFVPNIDIVFNASAALFGMAVNWFVPLSLHYKMPAIRATLEDPELLIGDKIDDVVIEIVDDNESGSAGEEKHEATLRKMGKGAFSSSSGVPLFGRYSMSPDSAIRMSYAKDIRADSVTVATLSILGFGTRQARSLSRVFSPFYKLGERIRTRSLVRKAEYDNENRNRTKSMTEQKNKLRLSNISSLASRKHLLRLSMSHKRRKNTIADSRPTQQYSLLHSNNSRRSACGSAVQAYLPEDLLIGMQVAKDASPNLTDSDHECSERPETLAIDPVGNVNEDWRRRQMNKMTKGRKGGFAVASVIIIAVNFTSFFLSTFVDTVTFRFLF